MKRRFTYYLFAALLFAQCNAFAGNDTLVIAISKFDAKGADTVWLKHFAKNVRFINLYKLSLGQAMVKMKQCNALLLTGGEDVNPALYHKENEQSFCEEADKRRDSLETASVLMAMQMRIPVLGICRGEQIMNVTNGGSLITDIPHNLGTSVQHNTLNGKTASHTVKLDPNSRLYAIIKQDSGTVNSFHHQCVERTGADFKAAARTHDGVIEAIEFRDPQYFAIGVQWHPERMPISSPFAYNIGYQFILEAQRNVAAAKRY